MGEAADSHLLLYHIDLVERGARSTRARAFSAFRTRLEQLMMSVTEVNQTWEPACIDHLDNESLFLLPAHEVATRLQSEQPRARVAKLDS